MLRNIFRKGCLNHSIYDWIILISNLFIPVAIGILTIVLPLQQENLSERENVNFKLSSLSNLQRSLELFHDEQEQIILNTYQQDLADLIFKYESLENSTNNDDDERTLLIIRTKTFHALRQLDPTRKMMLIQLLVDSGAQHRINISYIDLSSFIFPQGSFYNRLQLIHTIGRNISFKNVYLHQSNFSHSILDDSSFRDSNCSSADFSYASLQRTDWTNTDVTQAVLNYTNLHGANITNEQLAKVQSFQGAILPNGTTAVN